MPDTTDPKTLYVIATPIGHPDDLTLRAREILNQTDIWLGESTKGMGRVKASIARKERVLFEVIDHKTDEKTLRATLRRHKSQSRLVWMTDGGLPGVADPGYRVVEHFLKLGFEVVPIPGASSILAALSVSGFPSNHWVFAGFLPRDQQRRRQQIQELNSDPYTLVVMETPYRMHHLLDDLAELLTPERPVALCWKLTQAEEKIYRGNADQVRDQVQADRLEKGEFILVISATESTKG